MKKNFTQLINSLTPSKKYVIALTSLMIVLAGSLYLYANILAITPQNVSVSADRAVGGPSAAFTDLNPIVIEEGDQKDFKKGSGNLILNAPSGWVFRQNGVSVGGSILNLTIGIITYTSTTITIPITVDAENKDDKLEISGVALQATTGTILPARAVTLSFSGLTVAGYTSPITVANISQTYGSASKLAFGQQPTDTDIYTAISPAPSVLIQDWAGNTVMNATNNVSLAIGNNPSAGVLMSGSNTRAGGVATFSGYSIDASGTGYTLVASSGSLTQATSSAFTINSTTPVLTSIEAPCFTIGAAGQEIILRGSNFARNAVGRIGGSSRTTTFVSPSELRMTLLDSDLSSAGSKNITVVNSGPTTNVSSGQTLVIHNILENITIGGSTLSRMCTGASRTYSGPADYTDYEWSVTAGATVVSQNSTSNTVTIRYDNVPASGKVTITVNAKNPCGVLGTKSFDILVNQTPSDIITFDTPITFCEGGSVVLKASEAPIGEPAYTYQWQFNGTNIPDATLSTYTAVEAGSYKVRVAAADPNTCSDVSSEVTVSITSPLSQGEILGNTAYCQSATATALSATIDGGISNTGITRTRSYFWEQSSNGLSSWTGAAGVNTSANYTPSTATAGTMYYRRTVYAGGCENTTEPVAVTITPTIENSLTSANQVVCSGESVEPLTGTLSGGEPGDVTYLWEQSPNGTNSWTEALGTNSEASYTPASENVTTTKTTYYRRKVISGNCTSNSNIVSVRITARPVATITQGTNTYFCPPGTATLTAASVTGATYEWFKVGETGPVGITRIIDVPNAGEYYVVVTANNCSSTSSNILVQETVVGNNILNNQDQLVCYGATPETLLGSEATSTLGVVSYQWQSSSNGTTFSNEVGGATIDLELGSHTADKWYRRLATVGSCTIISDTTLVAVKPELRVTNLPSTTPAVCNNTVYTFTPDVSVAGASTAWTRAAVAGISNTAASGTGAINETLVNTTANPINVTYTYITSGNVDCEGAPQNLVVRVNPTPVLSSMQSPTAICSGANFIYTASSATTGTSFSWVRQPAAGITTGAAASGTTAGVNHALTNTTSDPINVTYTYTLTANGCSNTQEVVVTVNPSPQLSSTLAPPAICSGGNFIYTPTSATQGATFSWTRLAAANITSNGGTTGTGNVNQTLTNSGTAPVNVTYRFTSTANSCAGITTQDVVVTVNPSPMLSSTLSPPTVCSESTFTYNPTSATAGATYSWTRAAVPGISNAAVTTPVVGGVSETLVNTTGSAINVTYVFTTAANGCTGAPQNVVVSVSPNLPVSFTGDIADNSVFYTGQGSVTLAATPTGGAFSGPGVSGTTFNPCTAGAGTHTIRYTRGTGSCTSIVEKTVTVRQSTYTVIVEADPYPTCRGQNTIYTAVVYRDVESVLYPYLTNSAGVPIDGDGNLIGNQQLPVANPAYPIPNASTVPQVLKDNVFRYFQPIVTGGVKMDPDLFNYQWTKNQTNDPGADRPTFGNAGLSSLDYYAVKVSSKSAAGTCITPIVNALSDRKYSSATVDYEITMTASPAVICKGDEVTLSANLDTDFGFWSNISLTLNWMLDRSGTISLLGSTNYTTGDVVEFNTTGPAGGFIDGDKVYIEFTSALDQFNNPNKCSRGFLTNIIPLTVNDLQAATATPKDPVICVGGTETFTVNTAATGTAPVSYVWSVGTRTYTTTTGSLPVIDDGFAPGTYPVSVVVSNPCNSITVPLGSLTIRKALTPFTVSGGGSYCTGDTRSYPIVLSSSESGVNYTLLRGTIPVETLAGTGGELSFTPVNTLGNYTIRADYAVAPLCAVTMAGSAAITENPLPLARTANNPSYCSLSSSGAEVVISNPEAGVSYQLVGSDPAITFNVEADGSVDNVPAGTYTVQGVNSLTGCSNPSVGTVTVTDTKKDDAFGDITHKWIGSEKWELTAMAEAVIGVTIPSNAVYSWFVKYPGADDFVTYPAAGSTQTVIVENLPAGSEVIARVSLTEGDCQLVVFVPSVIIPLPVELIYFKAEKRGNDVAMEWATASEQDNKGFEVQVSTDAKNFRSLGFVESHVGTTSLKQVYTFVDKENGKHGTRYYRLKQVDLDGKFEYFSIKAVRFGEVTMNKVKAYPNPFESEVELSIDAELNGEVLVTVTNATGQQLLQRTIKVEKGANVEKLVLDPNLPRGIYIISTRMGDFTSHFKLLKQ